MTLCGLQNSLKMHLLTSTVTQQLSHGIASTRDRKTRGFIYKNFYCHRRDALSVEILSTL